MISLVTKLNEYHVYLKNTDPEKYVTVIGDKAKGDHAKDGTRITVFLRGRSKVAVFFSDTIYGYTKEIFKGEITDNGFTVSQ